MRPIGRLSRDTRINLAENMSVGGALLAVVSVAALLAYGSTDPGLPKTAFEIAAAKYLPLGSLAGIGTGVALFFSGALWHNRILDRADRYRSCIRG